MQFILFLKGMTLVAFDTLKLCIFTGEAIKIDAKIFFLFMLVCTAGFKFHDRI